MLFTLLIHFSSLQLCPGIKEAVLGDELSHGSHLFPLSFGVYFPPCAGPAEGRAQRSPGPMGRVSHGHH